MSLNGCTFDSNIQDIHSSKFGSASRSDSTPGLKLTRDYADNDENFGNRALDTVVIKTVMTCKNQGMKFVKWTRRCKFSQTGFTEQVYKFLAVSIALIL